jgi:hypothetical protein
MLKMARDITLKGEENAEVLRLRSRVLEALGNVFRMKAI